MTADELDVVMRMTVLDNDISKIRNAQRDVNRFNGDAATGFKNTGTMAKRASRDIGNMSSTSVRNLKLLASSVIGMGSGLTLVIGAITLAKREFDEAARAAADYQKRMLEISTLSEMNQSTTAALASSLQDLTVRFGQVDSAMAKAQYDVMSSGFSDIADSTHILDVASRAAIGGVTDVATAAKLLTQVINAYGMKAKDADDVSDILFATVRDGVTTFEELAQNLGNVTSTAATAKISLVEVSAAIAVMTKRGINTAEAVTALNGLIIAIGAATGESKQKLIELGISLDNGLAPALRAINEAGGDNLAVLRELIPDMRALKAAAAAGADGARELSAEIAAIGTAAGSADKAYGKMKDGMSQSDAQLTAAKERLKKSVGGVFTNERAAAARAHAGAINDVAKSVENLQGKLSPYRDMSMAFSMPQEMGRFDAAVVAGPIEDALVYTERFKDSLVAIDRASKEFFVKAPEQINEMTDAEKKAADQAAKLAEQLRALRPVAQGLGLKTQELRVAMDGRIAWVDKTPEDLVREINSTVQYAYESSQKPMIVSVKVRPEVQGPLIGLDSQQIKDANDRFRKSGQRALSIVESGVLSLGGAITGSLSNALVDAKAKLIDIGTIGRSVFGSLIGGLVSMGIGYAFPALKPFLSATGGPVPAYGPRIVGEYGPELFVPNGPGRIVPSNTTKSMSGGGDTVHIDARSTFVLPASSLLFMDSPSAMRRLAETTARIQETKISRTYKRRS